MDINADINWIKAELDNIHDPAIINWLVGILRAKPEEEALDPRVQAYFEKRADKAEEDLAAGRVHTPEEAREHIRKYLGL